MSHDELAKADWEDSEHIKRLATSYSRRYDQPFWNAMKAVTASDSRTVIADFGCGPGLFLLDAAVIYRAEKIFGLDESPGMLDYARGLIERRLTGVSFELIQINFDSTKIPIPRGTVDLAFCGFMLHEVRDPRDFVGQVVDTLTSSGSYVIYDYVSGNEEAFVQAMMKRGMDEAHARKRYPHMCKHSIDDLVHLLKRSGLAMTEAIAVNDIRAVVLGKKEDN